MEEKKSIAVLSIHSSPLAQIGGKDNGGMSVYLKEISYNLAGKGHKVDIFTRSLSNNCCEKITSLSENCRLIELPSRKKGYVPKEELCEDMPFYAAQIDKFTQAQEMKYNLIFSNYWLSGLVGKELQQLWRIPHSIMFHTLGAAKNLFHKSEVEPQLRMKTENELIKCCDLIIVPSKRESYLISSCYDVKREKICVIHCGVNGQLFYPSSKVEARRLWGINQKLNVILYVGRLELIKGIDRLIESLSFLPDTRNFQLLIAGGDSLNTKEKKRLQDLAKFLQVENKVRFLGTVSHDVLASLYNSADVTVLPSYYESFGLVALESIASGTPVVANDVGDLKEIIVPGKFGYVLSSFSPQNLAQKINEIFEGSCELSMVDVENCIKKWNWSQTAAALEKEWDLLLRNQRAC